jgi:hypothetical protein
MNLIGKIWALPTTLFGLLIGFIGVCIAPKKINIKFAHNAICFYNHPLMKGRAIALTLGNVILFQKDTDMCMGINIAQHERQHTIQGEYLGILYIPLHVIFIVMYFKNPLKNPLERGPYSNPPRPW